MISQKDPAICRLLERLLHYDPQAWNELVEMYAGLLAAIVRNTFARYGLKPASADVEDMVAAVWQNLLANDLKIVRQCLLQGCFLQTLHVLARNRTIDMLRKRKPEMTVPLDGHEPMVELPDNATPALAAGVSPAQLHQAVATLNAKERALITLFFLQRKKYKEIALLTGIPINSIGPTIGRALIKLRQALHQ